MIHDTRTETVWFMTKSMNTWHVLGTGDRALCRSNVRPYSHTFSEAGKAAWCIPTPECLACSRKLAARKAEHASEDMINAAIAAGEAAAEAAAEAAKDEAAAPAGRQLWIAGRFNTQVFHAQTPTGSTFCNKSATGDAMTVDALPDHASPCDECNAILRAVEATADLVALDDPERTISIVASEGIAWDGSGRAVDAGGWLGNATEHDREAIRKLAREVSPTGHALRVSFPSVLTFVMDYAGGRFRVYVPSDHAPALTLQVLPLA